MIKKFITTTMLMLGLTAGIVSLNVNGMEFVTSNHIYTKYSINMSKGQSKLLKSSELVSYLNANEDGYKNSIETSAFFRKTGGSNGVGPVMTQVPLTQGAGLITKEITDSVTSMVTAVNISASKVGCTRLDGQLEWRDNIKKPSKIHYYPFRICVYIHNNASGIKIVSNAVNDAQNIDYYIYEGGNEKITTNVLPFKSNYLTWDKVSNNAMQNISYTNSNSSIAAINNFYCGAWSPSSFYIKGIKEGNSTIGVKCIENGNYARNINVRVYKKPTYKVSENEITLAKGVTVTNCIKGLVSNTGRNKVNVKWTSSNSNLLKIEETSSLIPTLKTNGTGTVTLKCEFSDLVSKNNKTVNPTTINVQVNIKDDKEIRTKLVTANNTYIEDGDSISSLLEGDIVYVRAEEEGMEAIKSFSSSDTKVCKVSRTSRTGYSFQIEKGKEGTAIITVKFKSGKKISFKYIASKKDSPIVDPYTKEIQKASGGKVLKPKFKITKIKNKTIYISIAKQAKKYKATGFQVKVKRGKKTVIKTSKIKKKNFKIISVKKGKTYTIYVRTYRGKKHSKWVKIKKKIK